MLRYLIIFCFMIISLNAKAETYSYAASKISCRMSATKEAIGKSIVDVGGEYSHIAYSFGFQLFKSEVMKPRFTSIITGDDTAIDAALLVGGIPNFHAKQNWTVTDNRMEVTDQFVIGGLSFPIVFKILPQTSDGGRTTINVKLVFPIPSYYVQEILSALGDVDTPDFSTEPPTIDTSSGYFGISTYAEVYKWGTSAIGLTARQTTYSIVDIQIHYPPEKHNGLSYHLKLKCSH